MNKFWFKSLYKNRSSTMPRIWSNSELKKFSYLFKGEIVNVSGWKDIDKEGNYYKNYFTKVKKYTWNNRAKKLRSYIKND